MVSRLTFLLSACAVLASPHVAAQALFTGNNAVGGNANAGLAVYVQSCMSCHGARLEGSPFGPTLLGAPFMNKWRGKPAAALLTQIRNTMPPKGSGTVNPAALPDLLALLVKANLDGPPTINAAAIAPTAPLAPVRRATVPKPLPAALAQRLAVLSPVTDALLIAPLAADWLLWRRTFDAAGFSPLQQIDRANVAQLRQAWSLPLDSSANEITPLVHDGVLFIYSGGTVLAIDGASGTPLWSHEHGSSSSLGGQASRMKSLAIHGHSLFVATPDGHMLALDTRNGKVLWKRAIAGVSAGSGLSLTSGPLVAGGVLMIGASLGLSNRGGCFIVGLDIATGKERWRFNTIARPGTKDDSWNGVPVKERFGGGVWATGSYDPQLNLAYFGIGNTYTTAALLEPRRGASVTRNDALYTDTTVALRPATGELVWHYQHHRRDVWDQDWAFEQTLVTLGSGANTQRAVVTAGKTGVFDVVDAATGKFLFAHDSGLTNLIVGIDPQSGEKRTNPALEPVAGQTLLLCPGNFGARNWPASTLNPVTGMLFVPMLESCADFAWMPPGSAQTANGGTDIRFAQQRPRPDSDGNLGRMLALDLNTRRVQWMHRQRTPLISSLLSTAGGLVFMGDLGRNFGAFDQDSGARLWTTQLAAAAESTPITYAVGNQQYLAVVSGEASRLGQNIRRLDSSLGEPQPELTLVVFALPAN